jgi:hypothetical protein
VTRAEVDGRSVGTAGSRARRLLGTLLLATVLAIAVGGCGRDAPSGPASAEPSAVDVPRGVDRPPGTPGVGEQDETGERALALATLVVVVAGVVLVVRFGRPGSG